jgi:hypothetical protein
MRRVDRKRAMFSPMMSEVCVCVCDHLLVELLIRM